MGPETLTEQLRHINDGVDVDEVIARWRDEDMRRRTIADPDVTDPGEEVGVGTNGRVAYEDLADIERIILPDVNFLPVHFLEEGATKQKAVARIARKQPYGAWGTGWMVGRDVMMTNNHVIQSVQQAKTLQAEFNYQLGVDGSPETPDIYQFDPDGFFYTNAALDFTLVKVKCRSLWIRLPLKAKVGADGEYFVDDTTDWTDENLEQLNPNLVNPTIVARPIRLCLPASNKWGKLQLPSGNVPVALDQHINVVQHPQGRRKEVALQQNRLTHIYANHLRYTTDTEPGSSGSPVFNNAWDVVAIHHAGGEFSGGQWRNNQGVRIDRIVDNIQANHPAGSWIRNQLGV